MMARMTKELKPKEQKAQIGKELSAHESTMASSTHDEKGPGASPIDGERAEEELATPAVPLWRRMLPYIFQMVFPFVLYYTVVYTSKPKREMERTDNEL